MTERRAADATPVLDPDDYVYLDTDADAWALGPEHVSLLVEKKSRDAAER